VASACGGVAHERAGGGRLGGVRRAGDCRGRREQPHPHRSAGGVWNRVSGRGRDYARGRGLARAEHLCHPLGRGVGRRAGRLRLPAAGDRRRPAGDSQQCAAAPARAPD